MGKTQRPMHHNNAMAMNQDPLMGPEFELAKAYVRIQTFNMQYRPSVGLIRGTIFPELYRPYPPCQRKNDC